MRDQKISQALQLLRLAERELSVKEAIAIIELVTSVQDIIKEALKRAEKEGLIKREKSRIIVLERRTNQDFDYPKIKRVSCDDTCKRCGRKITVCNYILLQDAEIGPLGSECVKRLKLQI